MYCMMWLIDMTIWYITLVVNPGELIGCCVEDGCTMDFCWWYLSYPECCVCMMSKRTSPFCNDLTNVLLNQKCMCLAVHLSVWLSCIACNYNTIKILCYYNNCFDTTCTIPQSLFSSPKYIYYPSNLNLPLLLSLDFHYHMVTLAISG